MTNSNNFIAGAAVTSPAWLPILQHFSELSALLLPIVGCAWLIIQILGYFTKNIKKDKDTNERT